MSEGVVVQSVAVADIHADSALQPRVTLDLIAIAEYAAAMADGVAFPPVVVYHDGEAYWLSDGFHRYHATHLAGVTVLLAEVRTGTRRDALLHGVGSNADHGVRRTNDDKRRAVEVLLADPEWAMWGDSAIGRACRVDHKTVTTIRTGYLGNSQDSPPPSRLVERNGTTYRMDTARIGGRGSPEAPAPQWLPDPQDTPLDPVAILPDDALGRLRASNLRSQFARGVAAMSLLMLHDPTEIAGALDAARFDDTTHFIARLRTWLDALERAATRGLHLVENERTTR